MCGDASIGHPTGEIPKRQSCKLSCIN